MKTAGVSAGRRQVRGALELAICGAALTVCALAFGCAPLIVPGLGLLALGVVLPAWVCLSLRAGRVQRRVGSERVVEGEALEVVAEVSRGLLGLPGAQLIDPLAGGPVSLGRALSPVSGRARTEVRLTVRLHRRGLHRLPPPALAAADPLGLIALQRSGCGGPQELLVLPRTEPVSWPAAGRGQSIQGDGWGIGEPPGAVDIDGLRPYRVGTSASRIHWPALARGAGLLERRLVPDGDDRPLVILDSRDDGDQDALDDAVRAAASLTLALARSGGVRLLLPGERRAVTVERELSAWPMVHRRLALVVGGTQAPRHGSSLQDAAVLWVAARAPARLPAALAGVRDLTLVLPERQAGSRRAPSGLRVNGCVGLRMGRDAPISVSKGQMPAPMNRTTAP